MSIKPHRMPKSKTEAMQVIESILSKYWQTAVVFALDINDEAVESIWTGGTGLNTHREGLVRRAFGEIFPKEADHDED